MNILISTTTNWNCGDDFIRYGVKNILKHIFQCTTNYIHYDRNPNNMIDWPSNQNMKAGLHGNFMNNPIDWDLIDLVVLAGTPEFLHHPLMPIYNGLVKHPEIPLWAIGVGYTEPEFVLPLSENEISILKRKNTLIITRQEELTNRLFTLLKREVYTLPCPALFCFEDFPEKTNGVCNAVHSINELHDKEYFSTDAYDMLNYIGSCKKVISGRLHGVIAGISAGAYCRIINDSFRVTEAIKLFSEVLESSPEEILPFKIRTLTNYINIIKPYADTLTTK